MNGMELTRFPLRCGISQGPLPFILGSCGVIAEWFIYLCVMCTVKDSLQVFFLFFLLCFSLPYYLSVSMHFLNIFDSDVLVYFYLVMICTLSLGCSLLHLCVRVCVSVVECVCVCVCMSVCACVLSAGVCKSRCWVAKRFKNEFNFTLYACSCECIHS